MTGKIAALCLFIGFQAWARGPAIQDLPEYADGKGRTFLFFHDTKRSEIVIRSCAREGMRVTGDHCPPRKGVADIRMEAQTFRSVLQSLICHSSGYAPQLQSQIANYCRIVGDSAVDRAIERIVGQRSLNVSGALEDHLSAAGEVCPVRIDGADPQETLDAAAIRNRFGWLLADITDRGRSLVIAYSESAPPKGLVSSVRAKGGNLLHSHLPENKGFEFNLLRTFLKNFRHRL